MSQFITYKKLPKLLIQLTL